MDNVIQIDMVNDVFKIHISAAAMRATGYTFQLVTSSWNEHPIASKFQITLLLYDSVIQWSCYFYCCCCCNI